MSELSRKRHRASVEPSPLYLRRRKALINAATDVFRMKGFADASLHDVGVAIGVDRASLYYYFDSKEQLFRAVILDDIETVVGQAEAIAREPGSARERLHAVIAHVVDSFRRYYPSLHIFVQEDMRRVARGQDGAERDRRRLAELADLHMEVLESLVREGVRNGDLRDLGDPHRTALVVQGSLNGMHRWFDPTLGADDADLAQLFASILLDGLGRSTATHASAQPEPLPTAPPLE